MSRICIFSAQYLPHLGGVERYSYNLAKYLKKKGDHVAVVTSGSQNLPAYEEMEGVEIYRLPCFNLMDGRYPVLKPGKAFFKIHKFLMRKRFDLVLINTRFYLHSVYGAFFAKKQRTKCIMVEHGTGHLTLGNSIGNFISRTTEHFLTLLDRYYCKDFYGVSQDCVRWLEHFHIKAKGVLYNAVDLKEIERFRQNPVTDFREKYQVPDEAIVVTFTGRLLKEKGVFQLMEAVKKLRSEGINLFLFIAGDGEEAAAVRDQAGEGIVPLGRLDFEKVIALLDQSDIFCLPTAYAEGFPTSVLEAAACRCYIVTTEKGGSKEMILNKEYGLIMKSNDSKRIADVLRKIIPREEYRKKAAEAVYQRLTENYTWDTVAEKVHTLAEIKKDT